MPATQTRTTHPPASRGDVVVVESADRRGWTFGLARVCPGGILITFTPLGQPDRPENWIGLTERQRYRVLFDPDDAADDELTERRFSFLDAAGAEPLGIPADRVAALIDQYGPLS